MGGRVKNRNASVTQGPPRLGVLAAGGDPQRVAELSRRLGLPVVECNEAVDVVLAVAPGYLELRHCHEDWGGVRPDPAGIVAAGRQDPLLRAVGPGCRLLVDATAGLGTDAVRLARAGLRVLALERHPVLALLLDEVLGGAPGGELRMGGGSLRVEHADARERLPHLAPVDVVYLDPMYPAKRKASALARKEVRLLRALVGDDPDVEELLSVARRAATRRVVVKRPQHAPALDAGGARPSGSISGKLVRYDLYPPAS
ncbi:MAG: class I SAM-dependent methyltransferase [Gammaproteobacteria bacterium]|nr:class I SAM-dependent methyltransferase [Gammaproteobacteria bacterium]